MARPSLTDDARSDMRQRLADAALDLHLSQGADAVSFRALAEALGISHTLIYRYFENKDALFAQVRRDAVRRFEAFVRARERSGETPMQRLRTVFSAYIEYVRSHPKEYLLILAPEQPAPDRYPELLAARQSLFDHAKDAVQACIDDGQIQGDALRISHAFWLGLHGLMTLYVANQLVHGCTLDELAPSLLNLLRAAVAPVASGDPRAGAPRRSSIASAKTIKKTPTAPKRNAGSRST